MLLQPSPPEAPNGPPEGDLVAELDKGEESVSKKKKKKKKKKAASAASENGPEGEAPSGEAIDTSEQNGQNNPGM
jgi:hypothetical protein